MNEPFNILRPPTTDERRVIERILEWDFQGVAELRSQLADALVRTLDDGGCLAISTSGVPASVRDRVPTEGYFLDDDGVRGHVLLHVVDGRLSELEIYKEDNSPVLRALTADDVKIAEWLRSGE